MEIYIAILMTVLGLMLGSFCACMGFRIPNKISLVTPGSFCESCKKELKWYMNVPFFSYVFLRGKCAYCKEKINPLTFIVEVVTGIMFLAIYLKYGFSINGLICYVLVLVLAVSTVSDMLYYYISDRVVGISYIAVLVILAVTESEVNERLFSSAFMFALFFIIKLVGDKVYKRESLGGGDVKLMALIGLSLRLIPSMFSLIISSVLALVYGIMFREKREIPFGPFLILGALIIMYFVPNISIF